jgi:hypothetical protein
MKIDSSSYSLPSDEARSGDKYIHSIISKRPGIPMLHRTHMEVIYHKISPPSEGAHSYFLPVLPLP